MSDNDTAAATPVQLGVVSTDRSGDKILIVGAGIAAVTTAESLRQHGFQGRILMASDEREMPYDKPPLSKQLLAGTWSEDRVRIRQDHFYRENRIELRLGPRAVGLDPRKKLVRFEDGTESYDVLVIATGLSARRLEHQDTLAGLCSLRTLSDNRRLRSMLASNQSIVIVGGGFIGLEVASTAVQLGARATVVEPLPALLAGALGLEIGGRIQRLHESNGVEVVTGTGVAQALGTGALEGLLLTDGRRVQATAAIVGIGSVPNADWLVDSGLPIADGVRCDEECRVVGEESIYAVGDIACVRHIDGRFARVEHWTNAVEHGERAARAILGIPTDGIPASVPYFWSDQFGVKFQYVGRSNGAREDVVMCRDADANGLQRELAIYHDGEHAIAALAINWPTAAGRMKKLLREPLSVEAVLDQVNAHTGRPALSGPARARTT